MSPAEYSRRRDRIEHASHSRTDAWRKRALKRLNDEAMASPLIAGHKVVGYRMKGGGVVCFKRRFASEAVAIDALVHIGEHANGQVKPIRAYACISCGGWHLTKMALCID